MIGFLAFFLGGKILKNSLETPHILALDQSSNRSYLPIVYLGAEFVRNSPCSNYPSHLTWQHSNQISKLIFTLLNRKNERQKIYRMLCVTHFQLCVNNLAQRHNFAINEKYLCVFSPHSVEHPNERPIALNNATVFLQCLLCYVKSQKGSDSPTESHA